MSDPRQRSVISSRRHILTADLDRDAVNGTCSIAEKLVSNEELVRVQLLENGYCGLQCEACGSVRQQNTVQLVENLHNDIVW